MEKKSFTQLALIGAVLSFPAALIVVTGLAQGLFGLHQLNDALDFTFEKIGALKALIHPVVVIGGLAIALGLNALPVFKFTFIPEDGTLVGVLRTKGRILNLATIAFSAFLLVSIFGYSIVIGHAWRPSNFKHSDK